MSDLDDLAHAFKRIGLKFEHGEEGSSDWVAIEGDSHGERREVPFATFRFDRRGDFQGVEIYG